MMRKLFLFITLSASFLFAAAQDKPLAKGMRISKSVKIKKAVYKLDAVDDFDKSVIVIEGEDITVDFNNATLQGSNAKKRPDEFFGVAIIIRNSNRVTIRNLKAKGYKIGLYAFNTGSLTIENCDFSYNYRQHLNSTPEKEDVSDWLSHHQNEKNEWRRYGAGIYLDSCDLAIIRNTTVTNGQNGLLMRRCNTAFIYNNEFSFNSGLGLGLYRCNDNKVAYNRIIFNVRGYSHGVYSRGQDSAGILVYEQSNRNFFYKNVVTHGGDGFFLWAGQQTMDSGAGGCNDNLLVDNDFSYAPTNGIEVTFSSNKIIHNRIFDCEHGIWGGYSYDTEISSNSFRNNKTAIAIEHGQNIDIGYNVFVKDQEAIRLWAREKQPADWIYAQKRDARSRNYAINGNSFYSVPLVYSISRSENLKIFGNPVRDTMAIFKVDSATVDNLDTTFNEVVATRLSRDSIIQQPYVEQPNDPFKGVGKYNGRKNIMITEWGPYNFKYPLVWLTNPTDTSGLLKFEIKGPAGKWKLKFVKGLDSLSAKAGEMGTSVTARKQKTGVTDIVLELEFSGDMFTDQFGNVIPKGKLFAFSYRKYFQPIAWKVRAWGFDSTSNPIINPEAIGGIMQSPLILEKNVNELAFNWWGGIPAEGKQVTSFYTQATGSAALTKGLYELSVTWDDAVRVYVDGKLVLDEWNPSKYRFDESPNKKIRLNLGGTHQFMVEHVELGGFATLTVKLNKISP